MNPFFTAGQELTSALLLPNGNGDNRSNLDFGDVLLYPVDIEALKFELLTNGLRPEYRVGIAIRANRMFLALRNLSGTIRLFGFSRAENNRCEYKIGDKLVEIGSYKIRCVPAGELISQLESRPNSIFTLSFGSDTLSVFPTGGTEGSIHSSSRSYFPQAEAAVPHGLPAVDNTG